MITLKVYLVHFETVESFKTQKLVQTQFLTTGDVGFQIK